MASEEVSGKREQIKLPLLPDYIVNFVDFKREMVRLDYTAEQLRRACQEVEERRRKMRDRLRRESDDVAARAHACHQRQLRDDQETLELQKRGRLMAERRRILEAELQTSRMLYQELIRKRAKLKHWLDGLEEHRSFLSEIISHKVSPRTPRSARQSRSTSTSRDEEDKIVEVMQNPILIRCRLAHKERNVIAQSRMVFQACQLMDRCCGSAIEKNESNVGRENLEMITPSSRLNFNRGGGLQSGLNDQIFAMIHRMYKQFIAPKSSSCDPLGNLAALERYAYYVLQMVDACDPAMLKKIIAKVVIDKKKTMEQEKAKREAAHRAERERKAQANAMSAPSQFRRVTVVNRNLLRGITRFAAPRGKLTTDSQEEVEIAPDDELLYLFRLQL
ncbi:uncharacterized protein LOC132088135 [Daphnia carinata]|uniref:uncharacterized protein LOC132088135 n=1 Tax=Daphnia carinata TaxID=120202 RepID=UPI002868E5C1|nr:uncharacterized protein LOC132088135 [Daphnia carinata]